MGEVKGAGSQRAGDAPVVLFVDLTQWFRRVCQIDEQINTYNLKSIQRSLSLT